MFVIVRYKCLIMRGEMDFILDKYEKFEELMVLDMDYWFCNMYFEIVKFFWYVVCIGLLICQICFIVSGMLYSNNI